MQKHTDFATGSLIRIENSQGRLNVIVQKVGAKKSLGRVSLVRKDQDEHGFNHGDVIVFFNSDVIEVLDNRFAKRFLEQTIEDFSGNSVPSPGCSQKMRRQ